MNDDMQVGRAKGAADVVGASDTAPVDIPKAKPASAEAPQQEAALDSQTRLRDYAQAQERPVAPPPQITPERKAQIDEFVAQNADATDRFMGVGYDSAGGERVGAALVGDSDLGRLTSQEQTYLAQGAAAEWQRHPNYENITEAADRVQGDPGASRALAGALAEKAAEADAAEPLAENAGRAARRTRSRQDNYADHMREIAVETDPAATAAAYAGQEETLGREVMSMSRDAQRGIWNAIADRRIDGQAADKLATTTFLYAEDHDLRSAESQRAMGDALAMAAQPGTDAASRAERQILADRLTNVLGSDGGRELLLNDKVMPEVRAWALENVMADPAWNADALSDGWESDIVTTKMGQETAERYAARGTEGQELTGNALRNTVGQAIGETPDKLPSEDETPAARAERLAAGMDHGYYGDGTRAAKIADMIEETGGAGAKVSVVPVSVTSNEFGVANFNVFRVERQDGSVAFVDDKGQRYRDLEHWQNKNELPPGRMTHAEGLKPGEDLIAPENTRMVVDTFGEHAGRVLDYTAMGVGVVAGAAIIIGTGGTAAIVAAGAAGAYTAGRAGAEIYDESQRGVDVFDMSNPENRSRWLEVAAGTLSVGAIGSGLKVANAARNGVQVTAGMSRTAAGLAIAADTADAVAMGDQAYALAKDWDKMSNGDRAAGMLNIAFWGGMAAASTKAGGAALQDAFSFARLDNTFRTGTPYQMTQPQGMQQGDIRVGYDVGDNGRATNLRIETGPGPVDADALALHTETARQMEAAGGLRDRLRVMLGGEKQPPVGSTAWEARMEIDKINAEAAGISNELAKGDLSPERTDALMTRQHELNQAISREQARLTNAAADPNFFVAAPRSLNQKIDQHLATGAIARQLPPGLEPATVPNATDTANIDYGTLNDIGQAQGISATLTRDLLDSKIGTKADGDIHPPGWEGGAANHSRGHLLAKWLGGSGSTKENLVTLFQRDANSPVMSDFEEAVYEAVKAGEVVNYKVTPIYDGAGMPVSVAMSARGSDGFKMDVTVVNRNADFHGPAAREYDDMGRLTRPGTYTDRVGQNDLKWITDDTGRVIEARAMIREVHTGLKRSSDEVAAQGRAAGRGIEGDHGGHAVPHRAAKDMGEINMFPQNGVADGALKNFNGSAYKTMENEVAAWVNAGAEVDFRVRFGEIDANGRPGVLDVEYRVTTPDGKPVYEKSQEFDNEAGQVYSRLSKREIESRMQQAIGNAGG